MRGLLTDDPMTDNILDQLVEMTRLLGQPQMNYVIVGEGNTSYRADDETFWIKASGQGMFCPRPAGAHSQPARHEPVECRAASRDAGCYR